MITVLKKYTFIGVDIYFFYVEKDFIKKKTKGSGKAKTESKIVIKNMRFNLMMKAFSSMKVTKKVYKKRSKN